MGCHTWFYRKVEIDYETAKSSLIKRYSEEINLCQKWIDNPTDPEYLEMVKVYTDWTIDNLMYDVEVTKRRLRLVEGGYCKLAVMHKYQTGLTAVYRYVNNIGMFKSLNEFHDIFRIHNYPEDQLFSLIDTLQFIEDHKAEITYHCQNWESELLIFWNKYPDGMITFG